MKINLEDITNKIEKFLNRRTILIKTTDKKIDIKEFIKENCNLIVGVDPFLLSDFKVDGPLIYEHGTNPLNIKGEINYRLLKQISFFGGYSLEDKQEKSTKFTLTIKSKKRLLPFTRYKYKIYLNTIK